MRPTHPSSTKHGSFRSLDRHGVAYVLVGGLGALLHGASRPTLDFDLCAAWDLDNLGRLVDALRELGAELRVRPGVQPPTVDAHLLQDSVVTTWRTTAGDIDVLVGIPSSPQAGLNRFDSLRGRAEARVVAGCTVYVAALSDIIASKRVANRPADREALPELEALADQQAPGAEPERLLPTRWQPPGPYPEPPASSGPGHLPER